MSSNRQLREARAYVQEAMGLLRGRHWDHPRHLLDRVSDSLLYYLDAIGDEDEGMGGRHEKGISWPGRHSGAGQYRRQRQEATETPSVTSPRQGRHEDGRQA
jgi:hypothetical protein